MIRILHLADLHPNNAGTFAGKTIIDPETGLNHSLVDLQKSLFVTLKFATDKHTRCDLAVLPGDLFDSPRPHMNEVRIIADFIAALADEMPVLIIPGNHDLSQNTSDASSLACLSGISNVHIRETPDSILIDLQGQRITCSFLPYPSKGRLLTDVRTARLSPEEITAQINQGLTSILRGLAARTETWTPHILIAHGSVTGSVKLGDQPRSLAHDIQISLDECHAFDFVALGHIHQQQQVAENAWYSGSLMRQSFGEEEEAKGFNVVELCHGRPVNVQFVENRHARKYCTIQAKNLAEDLAGGLCLDPSFVWRVKGQLSAADYDALKPSLSQLQDSTPFFQQDIELVTADRARDAGMAAMLTMQDAIRRVLPDVPEPELLEILGKHERLESEVGA